MTTSELHSDQPRAEPILIPISNESDLPEWAMIELNGELLLPKECDEKVKKNPESMVPDDSFELGGLRFVNEEPILVCGTHELKGNIEKLKQPFCVLQKNSSSEQTSYSVQGVVTKKLLFNKYPKTIMR